METPKTFSIRPATIHDVRGIYHLIREHSDNLIPRSINDIVQNVDRFMVAEAGEGMLIGCIAYTLFPEIGDILKTSAELQSVCVRQEYRTQGVGRCLVLAQLRRIHDVKVAQVILLTFTPKFFGDIGFKVIDKHSLMHKIYIGCINCTKHESPFTCPEIAMGLDTAELDALLNIEK